MRSLFVISIILLLNIACDDSVDAVPYEPQLVVEGSIENGRHASVLLSYSASLSEIMDTTTLLNQVIKNAKVTVSDGVNSEVLLLRTNKRRIPPYEYVTTDMKGEVGKKYSLLVEYYGKEITGETYIPAPVKIDSLWFTKQKVEDSFGHINARFQNTSDYRYQFSTQIVDEEEIFHPCLYGNIDNTLYAANEEISLQINRGPLLFPETSYVTHFEDSLVIRVKLATQTKESYNFWTSYQNEILNSQNPIFPSTSSLKSNIRGGIGVWAGYGSSVYVITLSKYGE